MADDYAGSTAMGRAASRERANISEIDVSLKKKWFRVTLTAGRSYQFDLEASATGQGTWSDPFLQLRDSAGNSIAFDFDSGTGNNARITFAPSASGTYFLSADASLSPDLGSYRLSAADLGPGGDDYAGST